MKTIRVQYDEPARSKSRNVNAYTRAVAQRKALEHALLLARGASHARREMLTGAQLAEAARLLAEALPAHAGQFGSAS